ncbi:nicotinamide-nucleotide adenylyltransferase, NadR type [Duganella sp. CF458]|uniref:AAA family ATPase n=1 Tax=Duganella sp. CF458 TaxID=1884368 RepID=UPI0008E9FE0F|nr:AAA family ATPase [Duganella sp. CF458]SFG31193.1 nicotinamide-nucleotide adenylyltransferase, NadR type [Duganella sp. CF458]
MSYRHALVVGKFAPLHKGHQQVIECARGEAARVTVLCYATPDFTAMPSALRAAWIAALYPEVQVLVPEVAPPDSAPGPVHWHYLRQWLAQAGVAADVVFSSEQYGPPFAAALGVAHRMVDQARVRLPVSATAIRADVHGLRNWLAPGVYRHFVQRIALVGAESTGKSALAAYLARHCGTRYIPEIGREVWEARQGRLAPADYVDIAERHRAEEDAALEQCRRFLFVDTNALTTLLLGFCYGHLREAPPALLDYAGDCARRYHAHFLCGDEIPFHQDGWRDDATWRSRIQGMVRYDLQVRGIAYTELHGTLEQRAMQLLGKLEEERGSGDRGWSERAG